MRRYSDVSEEGFRARHFLKRWKDDGSLSEGKYRQLKQDTISDLRNTNIFLRIVLFLFTGIAVAAAVALFMVLFPVRSFGSAASVCFLVFAGPTYWAAEIAAREANLYRHGIEEALATCSVAFVCVSIDSFFLRGTAASTHVAIVLVSIIGAASSLWIWLRFGLWYAFAGAMIFTIFLPVGCGASTIAQRCLVCTLYAAGLICIAPIRSRHRFDYLAKRYSLAEAFLWFGMYFVLNLKLTVFSMPSELWNDTRSLTGFSRSFYWTTWVMLWFLPPMILFRGVRQKIALSLLLA